jgi:hypothetical protein
VSSGQQQQQPQQHAQPQGPMQQLWSLRKQQAWHELLQQLLAD